MSQADFIVLKRFYRYEEAAMCKSLLGSAGIESLIRNDNVVTTMPLYSNAIPIELVVRAEDAQRAIEFLNANVEEEEFGDSTD